MDSGGSPATGFIMFFILILLDAGLFGFCSAIRGLSDSEIEKREAQGDKNAAVLARLKVELNQLVNTIQFEATLIAMAAGSFLFKDAVYFSKVLFLKSGIGNYLGWSFLEIMIIAAAVICIFFIICIFGILLPKKLGAYYHDAWSFGLVIYARSAMAIFRPFTYLVTAITNKILKMIGIDPKELQEDVTEEEIISMVNEGHEQGVLEASEAEMINNIFELGDKEAQDIMIHRKNIVAVNGEKSLITNLEFMLNGTNSRFPVYEDNIDNITGILHLKDAMKCHTKNDYDNCLIKDIPNLIRPVIFIPETRNINQLFQSMQSKKLQMVMVADEYGQTSGLIALEDILEEIVGNIQDEYDEDEKFIEELPDGSYIMEGMTPLNDVEELIGDKLDAEDYETLNGFLICRIGKIPDEDESSEILENNYSFKILSVENKTIKKVKVCRITKKIPKEK